MNVTTRLLTVPVMFILAIAVVIASITVALRSQQGVAEAINVAGRQRMLNQRFLKEVMLSQHGIKTNVDATRSILVESVTALRDGGTLAIGEKEVVLPPAPNALLYDLFDEQRELLRESFALTEEFLEMDSSGRVAMLTTIAGCIEKTHALANKAVTEYMKFNSSRLSLAQVRTYSFGAIAVVVGLFWCWIVARKTVTPLKHAAVCLTEYSRDDLTRVSQQLKSNANETTDRAGRASSAAEEVSVNAQSLASAVVQFEASIKEIAGNASTAASVARNAVEAADQTNATITRLGASSGEIGNVIKVINSIAEQTNLLALNATIEAARAGEAGKGFAVVANEVKELAKDTSKATEDIIRRIETIQIDTNEAVDAIGRVSGIISEISESQNAIAGAVEEQTAMTSEISRNISQVASGSDEIAQSLSSVVTAASNTSVGSDDTLATACEIEAMAGDLLELVGQPAPIRAEVELASNPS